MSHRVSGPLVSQRGFFSNELSLPEDLKLCLKTNKILKTRHLFEGEGSVGRSDDLLDMGSPFICGGREACCGAQISVLQFPRIYYFYT
jgi:hypothetical protein